MSKLEIINGSCADQNVDAVVNAANRLLLSGGGICGVIFSKAGYFELNEACKKIETPLKDGDAVITSSFNMTNCKYIIHAVGPDFSSTPNAFDELFNAYYNSLVVLKDNNLHSISFPLISSGIFGYGLENPAMESAKQCIKAYDKFTKTFVNYEIDVKLCAFSKMEYSEVQKIRMIDELNEVIEFFEKFEDRYKEEYNSEKFISSQYNDDTLMQFSKLAKIGILNDEYVFKKEYETTKDIEEMNYDELSYLLARLYSSEKFYTGLINEIIKDGRLLRILYSFKNQIIKKIGDE